MAGIAALVALILFILATFGVHFSHVNIVDLGFVFLALAILLIAWPVAVFNRRS